MIARVVRCIGKQHNVPNQGLNPHYLTLSDWIKENGVNFLSQSRGVVKRNQLIAMLT